MNSLPFCGTRDRIRTLVACNGVVWVWPGIPLTIRRGTEIVPLPVETIRFWVTRLHGPEALYRELSSAIAKAAVNLAAGDELRAQQALDGLNLTTLSQDGVALMKALAKGLGLPGLDMSAHAGVRTWSQRDIAEHLSVFEGQLAKLSKGGEFDEAKHPRWPGGAPESEGGRFAPSAGSGSSSISTEPPPQTGRSSSGEKGPPEKPNESGEACPVPDQLGVGQDDDPPFDPDEEPPKDERSRWIRAIAGWIEQLDSAGFSTAADAFMTGLETAAWLKGDSKTIAELQANRDPPKTLDELYQNEGGPGYDNHHIVEKTPARQFGFEEDQIEASENQVYIPTLKHRLISKWYSTKNDSYGGLTPRQYFQDKSWDERRAIGIQKLKDFGVLKP
jgi:hypothetical protein